ncbi:MAG TPA: hypothetical protein VH079_10855, partial [Terriglobales bacterium]|nr:hypothetical protein [Terriglobales bacterium]
MPDALSRLKILIDSNTPIVVVETVEEMHAVRLVRAACASLNLAAFEWSIASGLARCGSDGAPQVLTDTYSNATGHDSTDMAAKAIY